MLLTPSAVAQKTNEAADMTFSGHVLEPRKAKLNDLNALKVPDRFEVNVFADDLVNPRMMAVSADGTVYVTRRSVGDVVMLRDDNGDGVADSRKVVANRPQMHGIAMDGDTMYLATIEDVYKTTITSDGSLAELQRIIDDLPDGGQHPNRTLGIGPDKMLYISVGSTCNACTETSPESATLLRASTDGAKRRIFASGLRNTIGFAWHPQTGDLFGMDHNIDWHGDDQPKEELNLLENGKQYGWPYVLADGFHNPQDDPPGDITLEQWAAASEAPKLLYTAHSAPMQMAFYDGTSFPADYRHDAFVAMRGSWNRKPPAGYEVVRLKFKDGKPVGIEPFLTGFLQQNGDGFTRSARPAGIAVAKDGALLVSDDENGIIYRVSYRGDAEQRPTENPAIAKSGDATTSDTPRTVLAVKLLETGSKPSLKLVSSSFNNDQPIPLKHSSYGQNISPPLDWNEGPDGTVSYVIIADDPDAKPTLVNHWALYNVPPNVTSLPEGVPADPRLAAPQDASQAATTRGATGYFGPKPPAGDPPHRYHFQVFALDRRLDLGATPSHDELLAAMRGHVLASGRLIGTFHRDKETQNVVDAAKDIKR
jgi:Raf kinase inhibitor-like YbhB/YbcL family protein